MILQMTSLERFLEKRVAPRSIFFENFLPPFPHETRPLGSAIR